MIIICEKTREIISKYVHNTIPFVAAIQKKRTWYFDLFFILVTAIAGTGIYATVIPTILFFYPSPQFQTMALAIVYLCYYNIVNLFGLPRPYGEGVWAPKPEKDFGFPSTHTINAIANTGFVVFTLTDGMGYRIVFILYVLCVAFSRMYMGVHSPADVACGLVIGTIHATLMINLYEVVLDIHSQLWFLPFLLLFHVVLMIVAPRCSEYNPTPRRNSMLCGCIFAASFVLSTDLQFKTESVLPVNEYVKYQLQRPFNFAFEFAVAISICLGSLFLIGFLVPDLFTLSMKKSLKTQKFLKKVEKATSRYRVHCLKDNVNDLEDDCNLTMLRYTYEVPISYIAGVVAGFGVCFVAPHVILYMNPDMVLE
ncbi:Sphingosine-1-phosphate phosphohydrolase [Entamoeba marina]